jgi:hypothetical protein
VRDLAQKRAAEPTLTIERWFLSVCYPKANAAAINSARRVRLKIRL